MRILDELEPRQFTPLTTPGFVIFAPLSLLTAGDNVSPGNAKGWLDGLAAILALVAAMAWFKLRMLRWRCRGQQDLRGLEAAAFSRATVVPFKGGALREDFIAMKVFAGGPQDLADAAAAFAAAPESEGCARTPST